MNEKRLTDSKKAAIGKNNSKNERGSFLYLTREGLRSLKTNKLMSFASIMVLTSCLSMIGFAILLFANVNSMINKIESENVIMVFMKDGITQAEKDNLLVGIESIDNVSSCEFISKEDSFNQQLKSLGDDAVLLQGLDKNPLPDAYKVTLKSMDKFENSVNSIKSLQNIISVRENGTLAEKLSKVRIAATAISTAIIILLLLVSLFIISNTIQVTIFSRRREISIMKAVGATNVFIRWPFMVEGVMMGIISGIVSLIAVSGIYLVLKGTVSSLLSILGGGLASLGPFVLPLLLLFLVIGIVAGTSGSAFSLEKYLKEEGSVLYEK